MLQLKNIVKDYKTGDTVVQALKGINMEFRKNEFVSILGQSGCGKTTMLNIIGGLDRYTSGDLVINNVSTKEYKDVDWDIYRNNSIGFVFQNYNLIQHQTVLSNVELALTLSGVSKAERRQRAIEVLNKVGLGDQIKKKPNQMSGGQMQRVAIARALVNNPDILLADEPTGALDSETSVQIMELLKEIAKDRLIIMVTHNPSLAEEYSTRIIKLLDGNVISDSNPYTSEAEKPKEKGKREKKKKISMSLFTALSLSLNNLMTKKARTFLTAFAGSIGIIGIALILSLSNGVQEYISTVESDTLSSYPIEIQSQSVDMTSMMENMMGKAKNKDHGLDRIYSSNIMQDMIKTMTTQIKKNDLKQFKTYLDSEDGKEIVSNTNAIQYGYDMELQIYKSDTSDEVLQVNPSEVLKSLGMGRQSGSMMGGSMMSFNIWTELINNKNLLDSQYDVLAGKWPENHDEIVLVVDENNEISDAALYALGLLNADELKEKVSKLMTNQPVEEEEDDAEPANYSYDELVNYTFKLILSTDYYDKVDGVWQDKRDNDAFMKEVVDSGMDIKIVGIVRPSKEAAAASINGSIGYTHKLTEYVINAVNDSEIVKEQKANEKLDIFTGKEFATDEEETEFDINSLTDEQKAAFAAMSEEELKAFMESQITTSNATYDENIEKLGVLELQNPSSIKIYPINFESKELITELIDEYNKTQSDAGHEEYEIAFTDIVGLMISGITSIINVITYVLIAFVAISLVVSSIMIGIITYISVLERTKEIGILRSIGASKKDISRLFNAETIIVGFVAGGLGIVVTLLLNIPINAIILSITEISGIASLPLYGAIGLILISMFLTVFAGLLPSKVAAKKDPVIALRSE